MRTILAWLDRQGSERNREGMARYGIVSRKAFGVSMATMKTLVKRYGRDHELATLLWDSGWHEARVLAAFLADPARLTSKQMDRWAGEFENWAVCDTVCFHLFDHAPFAWSRIERWSRRQEEFVKRAAFALLASKALHDKEGEHARYMRSLRLIERAACDDRNFVKKGVSWALRGIGQRDRALHKSAVALARRLAGSSHASARWVGKDALRDLTRPIVKRRLERRATLRAVTGRR